MIEFVPLNSTNLQRTVGGAEEEQKLEFVRRFHHVQTVRHRAHILKVTDVYAYIYTFRYINMYVSDTMYIYVYIYERTHIRMYVNIYVYMYVSIFVRIRIYIRTFT